MTIAQLRLAFALAPSCILLTMPLLISRRPILQQVRGHTLTCAPTDSQITVSCSISLPYRGSLSPFPRGTISLSVIQEYLALRGGPRRFTRDFTCPMLLGNRKIEEIFGYETITPYGIAFQLIHLISKSLKRLNLVNLFSTPQPSSKILKSLG